ncbi:MAG: hypothetical protein RR900_02530 [Ruthenibacterium sp.]
MLNAIVFIGLVIYGLVKFVEVIFVEPQRTERIHDEYMQSIADRKACMREMGERDCKELVRMGGGTYDPVTLVVTYPDGRQTCRDYSK